MLYLLVNNNYHLYDFNIWKDEFKDQQIFLIQIPHHLNVIYNDQRFVEITSFKPFFIGIKSLIKYCKIKQLHTVIDKMIFPQKEDILLVFTEYEILNQYIIQKFKRVNAKIWLLEDGLATMAIFNGTFKPYRWKHYIMRWVLRKIYGYKYLDVLYDGKNIFPIMTGKIFEGVCVSLGISIKRELKLFRYRKQYELISGLNRKYAIFLNEDIYKFYCDFDEYLKFLLATLNVISNNFDIVYFKFHPRESDYYRKLINKNINRYSNIIIIEENQIVEKIIENYKPKYAISFLSGSIINLLFKGLQPIYIYHLFPTLLKNPVLQGLTVYLESINYRYVSSLSEINDSYSSGIVLPEESPSLRELILG